MKTFKKASAIIFLGLVTSCSQLMNGGGAGIGGGSNGSQGNPDFTPSPDNANIYLYYTNDRIAPGRLGGRSGANKFCRDQFSMKVNPGQVRCENYFALISIASELDFLSAARRQDIPDSGKVFSLFNSRELHPNYADLVKWSFDSWAGQILGPYQASDIDTGSRSQTFNFSSQDLGSPQGIQFISGIQYDQRFYTDPTTGNQDYTKLLINFWWAKYTCNDWTFTGDPASLPAGSTANFYMRGFINTAPPNSSMHYWGRGNYASCVEPSGQFAIDTVLCLCW